MEIEVKNYAINPSLGTEVIVNDTEFKPSMATEIKRDIEVIEYDSSSNFNN